jgi:hypothetical protein
MKEQKKKTTNLNTLTIHLGYSDDYSSSSHETLFGGSQDFFKLFEFKFLMYAFLFTFLFFFFARAYD